MDISDIFAVVAYAFFILFVLNFFGAFFTNDIDTVDAMFKVACVFVIGAWIFGIFTFLNVSEPTPSQTIKVERYKSYSTEEVDGGTIYRLGNHRTFRYEDYGSFFSGSNKDVITKNLYGKKPKYRAKLVIKGFSDAQKTKLRANSWNFAKLMRTYDSPNDKLYTLYLYKAK